MSPRKPMKFSEIKFLARLLKYFLSSLFPTLHLVPYINLVAYVSRAKMLIKPFISCRLPLLLLTLIFHLRIQLDLA